MAKKDRKGGCIGWRRKIEKRSENERLTNVESMREKKEKIEKERQIETK